MRDEFQFGPDPQAPAGAADPTPAEVTPPDDTRAWMGGGPATRRAPLRISARELVIAIGLFGLTLGSTYLTGGLAYAGTLLGILVCHEMGHYLMARRYRVRSTLPIFLPLPFLSPFGTLGAIIKMRDQIRNRRVLYDIGIAGPLAGIPPALAAVVWGLPRSAVIERGALGENPTLGTSILFEWMQRWLIPGLSPDQDVILHPVAFAGWAGLFVTALNLIPIGQLDGGHVLYGLLGRRSVYLSWGMVVALGALGIFFPGWWFLLLLLLITRVRHPQTLDESVPLDGKRIALGVLALAFFVVSFIPRPITLP